MWYGKLSPFRDCFPPFDWMKGKHSILYYPLQKTNIQNRKRTYHKRSYSDGNYIIP